MDSLAESTSELAAARARLMEDLREHALVIGEVTLTSGRTASYYVDAKRAILLSGTFAALGGCSPTSLAPARRPRSEGCR